MRRCFIPMLAVIGLISIRAVIAMAGDTVSKEAERERELRDSRNRYVKIAEKEPTRENLLGSIEVQDAKGKTAAEAIAALHLMALDETTDDTLVPEILRCYENNPKNWTIRSTCARTLLNVKKKEGVKLSRVIFSDPKANLETKLLTSIYMIKVRELDGYAVLRNGLLSSKVVEEKLARDLLGLFREFDGVEIPATKEKIDIERLLAETEARKAKETDSE